MKKFLSVLLIIMIIASVITIATTEALTQYDKGTIDVIDSVASESKIISTLDINDNFKDDEVIVVLNNATSKLLKDYSAEDFSEISVNPLKEVISMCSSF